MALCPEQCADFEIVEIKSSSCKLEYRKTNIRAVGFYKCDVVLPKPLTCANITPLMAPTDPATPTALVFSNELVNVAIGEPVTEERKMSDSRPPENEVVEREITFEDRIKVDVNAAGASAPFADYDFWKDKKEHRYQLNFLFVMANGDLIVPREPDSNQGLSASFDVFINYETLARGGAIEFKRGSLRFQGDPLAFNKPEMNLNDCPAVAGLW